jgi:uncharacterized phage protein (TIGR02216 family)
VTAEPFPWERVIGFALGILRLPPDAFWRMTPRELAHAIAAVSGRAGEPLRRSDFEEMMARFPDERRRN